MCPMPILGLYIYLYKVILWKYIEEEEKVKKYIYSIVRVFAITFSIIYKGEKNSPKCYFKLNDDWYSDKCVDWLTINGFKTE